MPNQIDALITWLKSQLNKPYELGANGPEKWDCSSLVKTAFKTTFDIDLPRTSTEQFSIGTEINKAQLQPGDLIFFDTGWSDRIPNHLGVYIGNDMMINANSYHNQVVEENINSNYWASKFYGAKRIITPTNNHSPSTFTDVPTIHPYYPAIKTLFEKGVISGYPDGSFKPEAPINRAELLKVTLLAFAIPISNSGATPFSDVPQNQWFSPYISTAYAKNIISGYPDGTFKPENSISRAEAIKVILAASGLNLQLPSEINFSDIDKGAWYFPYLNYAVQKNMITPTSPVTLEPNRHIQRQEICHALTQVT